MSLFLCDAITRMMMLVPSSWLDFQVIIVPLLLVDKTSNNKDDVDINNNNIIDKTVALLFNTYYLLYSTVEYCI